MAEVRRSRRNQGLEPEPIMPPTKKRKRNKKKPKPRPKPKPRHLLCHMMFRSKHTWLKSGQQSGPKSGPTPGD